MAKNQTAPEHKSGGLPRTYAPSAAALQLPLKMDEPMQRWWGDVKVLKEFNEHIGNRGSSDNNAITWVRDTFIGTFMPKHFKDHGLSADDYEWYQAKIGRNVYDWTYRAARAYKTKGLLPTYRTKQDQWKNRAYGHVYWRRSDQAAYDKLLAEYVEERGVDMPASIGERSAMDRKLFALQPSDVQAKFQAIADQDLAASQSLQIAVNSDAKEKFSKKFISDLKSLIHRAEIKGGIKVCAQALMPVAENEYKIRSAVTPGMVDFAKTGPVEDLLLAMQDWVEETGIHQIKGGLIRISLVPDYSYDKFPIFPPIPGNTRVETIRGLYRHYWTLVWVFYGGSDRVPWTIMASKIEDWIPPECIPRQAVWADPGSMNKKSLMDWISIIHDLQDRGVQIWLRRTIAGPNPIDLSCSEEASRETLDRNGKKECYLLFDGPVSRSHAAGDLPYTQRNYEYAKYLAACKAQSAPKPESWLGLPSVGPETASPIFYPDEEKSIRELISRCPADVGSRIESVVNALNLHERNIPASTPKGIWAFSGQLPPIFPRDHATKLTANPFDPLCPPLIYLMTVLDASHKNTVAYFFSFVETALTGELLRHRTSDTLLGGPNGIAQIVRSLLLILFSVLAIRGELDLSGLIPSNYARSTLPFKFYERTLEWIDTCTELLAVSTGVLSQTSDDRSSEQYTILQSVPLFPIAESSEPSPETLDKTTHQTPVAGQAPSASPPPRKPGRSKGAKSSRGKKRRRSARDESEPSDEEESAADYLGADDEDESGANEWLDMDEDGDHAMPYRHTSPESEDDMRPSTHTGMTEVVAREYPPYFGEMQPLPPLAEPEYETAIEITTALRDISKRAIENLGEFRALGRNSQERIQAELSIAAASAATHPVGVRPLFQLYYLRQEVWKKTESPASMAISYCQLFLSEIRNFMATYACGVMLTKQEGPMLSRPGDTLLAQMHEAKRVVAQLKFAFTELDSYHTLATEWFHSVDPAWCTAPYLRSEADVRSFAKSHVAWAKMAAQLSKKLVNQRLQVLDELRIPHDDSVLNVPTAWFQFGCPSMAEEPVGLRDCLSDREEDPQNGAETEPVANTLGRDKGKPVSKITIPSQTEETPPVSQPTPAPSPIPPAEPSLPPSEQATLPPQQFNPAQTPPSHTASSEQQVETASGADAPGPAPCEQDGMDIDTDPSLAPAQVKKKLARTEHSSSKAQPKARRVSNRHREPDPSATSAPLGTRSRQGAGQASQRGKPGTRGKMGKR